MLLWQHIVLLVAIEAEVAPIQVLLLTSKLAIEAVSGRAQYSAFPRWYLKAGFPRHPVLRLSNVSGGQHAPTRMSIMLSVQVERLGACLAYAHVLHIIWYRKQPGLPGQAKLYSKMAKSAY